MTINSNFGTVTHFVSDLFSISIFECCLNFRFSFLSIFSCDTNVPIHFTIDQVIFYRLVQSNLLDRLNSSDMCYSDKHLMIIAQYTLLQSFCFHLKIEVFTEQNKQTNSPVTCQILWTFLCEFYTKNSKYTWKNYNFFVKQNLISNHLNIYCKWGEQKSHLFIRARAKTLIDENSFTSLVLRRRWFNFSLPKSSEMKKNR